MPFLHMAKLNLKSSVSCGSFTVVSFRYTNLLYFLPGVRLGSFTLWMYCFLVSFPPLTNNVEVPCAIIINPPSQHTTVDSSVLFAVLHVTNTSVKVSTPNKQHNYCIFFYNDMILLNTKCYC